MGNTHTREQRTPTLEYSSPQSSAPQDLYTAADGTVYTTRPIRTSHGNVFGRSGIREEPQDEAALAQRRQNRAEREVRKKEEKETARRRERERSMQEESVDGGFLVTSGLYISDEDYSKSIVRQLMIDRRLAPFYFGLEDHREDWAEHQLIAAVQGRQVPPADQPPGETPHWTPADGPIPYDADAGASNPRQPPSPNTIPGTVQTISSSPPPLAPPSMLRGRTKTPVSISVPSMGQGSPELHPFETTLPPQPQINGQRLEVFLYKDPVECEICYRSFPSYCNRSRCCDKPICSECFVSIKRKDPHPIERNDDGTPNTQNRPTEQHHPESEFDLSEIDLVSEPAKCPFCKENEFGVTYEPPPVRLGLVHTSARGKVMDGNAVPTPPSSPPVAGRQRAASLPANAPTVVTTDKIRPEWAKKLLQAKLIAAKRARAATALHQQAFLPGPSRRGLGLFRRGNSDGTGDSEEPGDSEGTPLDINRLIAAADRRMGADGTGPGTTAMAGSRAYRMSIEAQYEEALQKALRESIEDEQKRAAKAEKERVEKDKRKTKEEKQKAKEEEKQKKADEKAAKKAAGGNSLLNFPRAMHSSSSIISSGRRSSGSIDSGKGKASAAQGSSNASLRGGPSQSHLVLPTRSFDGSRPSSSGAASDTKQGPQPPAGGVRSHSQSNFGSLNALVEDKQAKDKDGDHSAQEGSSALSSFGEDMMSSMANIMGPAQTSDPNSPAATTESSPAGADTVSDSTVEPKGHVVGVPGNIVTQEFGSV